MTAQNKVPLGIVPAVPHPAAASRPGRTLDTSDAEFAVFDTLSFLSGALALATDADPLRETSQPDPADDAALEDQLQDHVISLLTQGLGTLQFATGSHWIGAPTPGDCAVAVNELAQLRALVAGANAILDSMVRRDWSELFIRAQRLLSHAHAHALIAEKAYANAAGVA